MRINGDIKSMVVNMMPSDSTKLFTGRIGITNLDGQFIIGYRVNNGVLISKLVKSQKTTTMHRKGQGELCDYHANGDPNCMFTDTVLDEVIITVQSNEQGIDPFDEGGSDYEDDLSNPEWNFGDGNPNGGNNNNTSDNCPGIKVKNSSTGNCECPEGYIEDINGNCIINPCDEIKEAVDSTNIDSHFNELKLKLNNLNENGKLYYKLNDGRFNSRNIAVSVFNFNSVSINSNKDVFGAGHTHTDDLFSMYSWSDVHSLYSIYNNSDSSLKNLVMYYLISRKDVNSDTNFYVIKVEDFEKLKTQLTLDIKNIIRNSLDVNSNSNLSDIIEILNKNLGNQYNSSMDLEKTFLERFKSHGIKLYKSNDGVTNLKELTIDSSTNTVKENPCN
jgi:hypothetical protein